MAALTSGHEPAQGRSPWPSTAYQKAISDGVTIYRNALVAVTATGEWVPAGHEDAVTVYGFARLAQGADGVAGNGTKELIVDSGCKMLAASGLTTADEGATVYAVDDQTVSLDADDGARGVAGKLMRVHSATSCDVAVDPIFAELAGASPPSALVRKKTVTVGHADLTETADDTEQAIAIGTELPNNAYVIGRDMRLTPFSGGGVSEVYCDVGTSGDVDALIDGADLFAAAVDGGPATMPLGVRPNKFFPNGAQLLATFRPDSGHDLSDLTAGSVTIDVLYVVLA